MSHLKQILRKVVIFGAALLISGIAAVLFLFAWLTHKDPALDRDSHAYADAAIVAVVKNWDEDALMQRGSIELVASAHNEVNLDAIFDRWRALGPMVKYNGSNGTVRVSFSSETGQIVTAVYLATADFQHGSARIQIGLVKRGAWQVASFQVYPSPSPQCPAAHPPNVRELVAPALVAEHPLAAA